MSPALAFSLAFGIGVVAGLRSLTAPAVVAWAAHLGWMPLQGTPMAFMGSIWAVGIFTVLALIELVTDQLPSTPSRLAAVPLTARIIMGLLTGACVGAAGGASLWLASLIGAVGAIAGAYGGYRARVGLVKGLHTPDFAIAIPEDLVAIALGLFLTSRF
ncbi:MAG TPA: DUF4126 family protein [Terriglobales bacterium]|nr:DUF4126 family protein [Terriglobales bacterium]